ncbi:MAG: cysteine hydrolase [Alphaproteobacteria bacterium]|nr:cysteine hydrolase [Alphaproteobacteria bacterium]
MTQNILMRVDFQNDFVHPHGALSLNAPELIEKHQKFADSLFQGSFDKIIDTYDTHFAETYGNTKESESFPPHCIQGSWGWQQAAPFKSKLEVEKMYKSTTNIWNEFKQYRDLQTDWSDKNVYLCGVLSDVCVKQALNGLLKQGANVTIIEDLCQGAQEQIGDILQKDVYQPFIEAGSLKCITTGQFFRKFLHEKKIQHNLVHKSLGD